MTFAERLDAALMAVAERNFKADTISLPPIDVARLRQSAKKGDLIDGVIVRYKGVGLVTAGLTDPATIDAHSIARADKVRTFKLVSQASDKSA